MLTVVTINRRTGERFEQRIGWTATETPRPGDTIERGPVVWHVLWRRWSGTGDVTIGVEEFARA